MITNITISKPKIKNKKRQLEMGDFCLIKYKDNDSIQLYQYVGSPNGCIFICIEEGCYLNPEKLIVCEGDTIGFDGCFEILEIVNNININL